MHTLRINADGLFNVWFGGTPTFAAYIIERDLPKQDALKLVNYLNGGLGLPAGSNVGIIDMDKI